MVVVEEGVDHPEMKMESVRIATFTNADNQIISSLVQEFGTEAFIFNHISRGYFLNNENNFICFACSHQPGSHSDVCQADNFNIPANTVSLDELGIHLRVNVVV